MLALHAIDWICLTVLAASLLLGAWRGLLYEALTASSWLVAYLAARWMGGLVGDMLPMGEASEGLRYAAGFLLVFIGFAFFGGMLAWALRSAVRALGMRSVDRVFGAVFGILRGVLLLLALAAGARMTSFADASWWQDSVSGPLLAQGLTLLQPLLPPAVAQYLAV